MAQEPPFDIILMGPPGSGKGTHAKLLAQAYGLTHVCMGDIVRAAVDPAGVPYAHLVAGGKYAADEAVNEMLRARLAEPDAGRVVFDGYPRTLAQKEFLREALNRTRVIVVELQVVNRSLLEGRVAIRAGQEGRPDDALEVFRGRLDIFMASTQPVIDRYRAELPHILQAGDEDSAFVSVPAQGTIGEVQADIRYALRVHASFRFALRPSA